MRSTVLAVAFSAMSVLTCGGDPPTGNGTPTVASVVVTPVNASLVSLGETVQLTASAQDASGNTLSGKTFTWSSSGQSVATVSSSGLVTAVANGSATITATTEGAEGTAAIEVAQAATQLAFTVQPTMSLVRLPIRPDVQVAIEDALGNPVRGTGPVRSVTVALGANPSGATLGGTTIQQTARDGIARFQNIAVSRVGVGYTLVASFPSLPDTTSAAFDVITLLLASVNAGRGHTCGIATSATTYCWGDGGAGQLGNGSTRNDHAPVTVSGGLTFASLSAGGVHTCAVTTSGAAYCWGFGAQGQLGRVAPHGCGDLAEPCSKTPLAVSGNISFTSISAGYLHTCAVTTSGTAYCWGANYSGALGDGTTTERTTPVLVSGGLTFQAVSAGHHYTCGIAIDGGAYCWGNNGDGQLGDGSLTDRSTPALVAGGFVWRTVSAGFRHTCGITVEGNAYCWGSNGQGQLGNGSNLDSDTPALVLGGLFFRSLSIGDPAGLPLLGNFTCGVATGGSAYCWGFGALGTNRTNNSTVPVAVSGGLPFESVTTGRAHACGVTTDHALYCWGGGYSVTPVRIGG